MMRRPLVLVAVAFAFIAGASIVSNADAPVAYREYQGNSVVRDWTQLPGTPCLTAGSNRRMAPLPGGQLTQCTPTTTTIPATTTTRATTTTIATTTAPPTTSTTIPSTTTTSSTSPTTTVPGAPIYSLTFDNNTGLDQLRWGVYHRASGYREMDQTEPFDGADNISMANGTWTGDHDLNCGGPDTQRPLKSEGFQDKTGANGWLSIENFHVPELVYVCLNHVMSSMGEASGYSILWFAPDVSLPQVNSVSFDVNLTNLGARKWWKVGVVSDSLYNSTCASVEIHPVMVRCIVMSDVGASNVSENLAGPDHFIATWSGGASGGYPGCLKLGDTRTTTCVNPTPNDKMTRHPVSLVDNHNGTVTFTVAGVAATVAGKFPACPCHVVFYDQNYTPDKDGPIQGYTWHWDSIVVR